MKVPMMMMLIFLYSLKYDHINAQTNYYLFSDI